MVLLERLQLRRLVYAFGSTRRKRQMDQKDQAKVGDGNVAAQGAVEDLLAAAAGKAASANMTKVRKRAQLICCKKMRRL